MMLYNCLIIAITAILFCCMCQNNIPTVLDVTSSTCVEKYSITNHFYVGYPVSAKILMCRCNCNNYTASQHFWQATEHHKEECNRHVTELRGFCFQKFQGNMIKSKCQGGGYGYCYIKMSAEKSYYFKTYDHQNTMIRLTYNKTEVIDVPAESEYVTVHGVKFRIYISGAKCDQTKYFIRSYENIRDANEKWFETCKTSAFGNKFVATNEFNITTDFSYHKQLWYRVEYSDGVCIGNLKDFVFSQKNEVGLTSCKKVGNMEFQYSDNTAYLYKNINVIVATFDIPLTTSTTTGPTTYYINTNRTENPDLKTVGIVTPQPYPSDSSAYGKKIQQSTKAKDDSDSQQSITNQYIIMGMLTFIAGVVTFNCLRQLLRQPATPDINRSTVRDNGNRWGGDGQELDEMVKH